MQQDEDNEIAERIADRRTARYCRQLSYQVTKIRQNDPSIVAIQVGIEDILPSLMKAMERNMYIAELEITCIDLCIGGVVGKMLQTNSSLRRLKILSCHVPTFSATTIFRSLPCNSTLEELDLSLSWGMFEGNGKEEVTKAISDYFLGSTSLVTLNLRRTKIQSDQILTLFQSIATNKSIEMLDLSENGGIGEAVATSLITYLPQLRFQILNVELTGISEYLDQKEDVMRKLGDAMESNTYLWKIVGIVLHQVDHYTSDDKRNTQRECLRSLHRVEFYKTRNAVIVDNWLRMDNVFAWQSLLMDVMQSANQFRNDLIFFLLREKCSWLGKSTSFTSKRHKKPMRGGTHNCLEIESSNETTRSHSRRLKRGRGDSLSWGYRATKQPCPRVKQDHRDISPLIISGYYCLVHAMRCTLPQGCCSFERRRRPDAP